MMTNTPGGELVDDDFVVLSLDLDLDLSIYLYLYVYLPSMFFKTPFLSRLRSFWITSFLVLLGLIKIVMVVMLFFQFVPQLLVRWCISEPEEETPGQGSE